MLRSLAVSEDAEPLQECRNLERKANHLHQEIQNDNTSTDRYRQQNKEPMTWTVELFQL